MTCPLCEAQSNFFLAGASREYWQCAVCRLIFVPAKYFISEKDEVQHYLKHENSLESEGYVQMFQEIIQVVKNLCRGAHTVLDYGCGYEPVLKTLLTREGFTVTGYDPHFFPELDSNATFDLIISTETFEHFKTPGKEITRLLSRLRPKGYLALMTRLVAQDEPLASPESFGRWYYQRDPTHIAFYENATFSWIARHHQMEILFNNEKDFVVLQRKP
jgi:2-polyprenyl-3-methyl-5-hydroxy-6-metoxy-1,4-benzoquinol methylase